MYVTLSSNVSTFLRIYKSIGARDTVWWVLRINLSSAARHREARVESKAQCLNVYKFHSSGFRTNVVQYTYMPSLLSYFTSNVSALIWHGVRVIPGCCRVFTMQVGVYAFSGTFLNTLPHLLKSRCDLNRFQKWLMTQSFLIGWCTYRKYDWVMRCLLMLSIASYKE